MRWRIRPMIRLIRMPEPTKNADRPVLGSLFLAGFGMTGSPGVAAMGSSVSPAIMPASAERASARLLAFDGLVGFSGGTPLEESFIGVHYNANVPETYQCSIFQLTSKKCCEASCTRGLNARPNISRWSLTSRSLIKYRSLLFSSAESCNSHPALPPSDSYYRLCFPEL